jgi:hypothetical protein
MLLPDHSFIGVTTKVTKFVIYITIIFRRIILILSGPDQGKLLSILTDNLFTMIELIPITVHCYSGYRADEYPVCVVIDDVRNDIDRITDRWYQGDADPLYPASDYFKVETAGKEYIIKHDLVDDSWFLCRPKID